MRTTIVPLLLLLLLAPATPARAGGLLPEARRHFGAGRFADALRAAEAVEADAGDFPRARYLAGEIHLLLGDADAAEERFRAALAKRPESVAILTGLGRALLVQDRDEEGVEVLTRAVRLDPKSARPLCFLGVAKLRSSYDKQGGKELAKASKLDPKDPEIARAVVLAWLDREEPKRARKEARRFTRARKEHPMGPFLEALVLEREGEFAEAIVAYGKAIGIDAAFLDAHKNLAILCIAQNPLYRDRKRTELALEHFERYKRLGGKDREVLAVYETLLGFLAANRPR